MPDDYILNFGIEWKRPIELQSPAISSFLDKLGDAAPTVDRFNEDTEKGKIVVFEQGRSRKVREVQLKSDGLLVAAGNELPVGERHDFLRIVASAAESLEIVKRDVSLVDLKFAFEIKHWGNHHDLAARAFCAPGALYKTVQQLGMPLNDLTIAIRTSPPGRDEFMMAVTVFPRTGMREIRSGEYDGDELPILCVIARTHGFHRAGSYPDMLAELEDIWTETASKPVMDNMVAALKRAAISERPQDRS